MSRLAVSKLLHVLPDNIQNCQYDNDRIHNYNCSNLSPFRFFVTTQCKPKFHLDDFRDRSYDCLNQSRKHVYREDLKIA